MSFNFLSALINFMLQNYPFLRNCMHNSETVSSFNIITSFRFPCSYVAFVNVKRCKNERRCLEAKQSAVQENENVYYCFPQSNSKAGASVCDSEDQPFK